MTRDETRFSPDVGSLYAFVEVTDWTVTPTHCTYRHRGGVTSSYGWGATITSQLQWWENGSWRSASGESAQYYGGYGDKTYHDIEDSFVRTTQDRSVSLGSQAWGNINGVSTSARAYIDFTVPEAVPPDATTLTAERKSDNRVALSWTDGGGIKKYVRIERSVDGGSWGEVAVLGASFTAWEDTTTTADHSYSYRFRYHNTRNYGAYSNTQTVTMSPAAPASITLQRQSGTDVLVTLENTSSVATSLEWEYSTDGGSSWIAGTPATGSPVTSFVAHVSGGTVVIHVRNKNAAGDSAWLQSDPIVTITPPNPPTLIEPSGGTFDIADDIIYFAWQHNAIDGTAQRKAQLQWKVNGGAWVTRDLNTSQQSHEEAWDDVADQAGDTITWRVRTWGAADSGGSDGTGASNWSKERSFRVLTRPTLRLSVPNPVTGLPIHITAEFQDAFGTCEEASLQLLLGGSVKYREEQMAVSGTTLTAEIDDDEFTPVNGETYTVVIIARSSSTMQTEGNASFLVEYTEPVEGSLEITNDPETGYAFIVATFDNSEAEEPAVSISVSRVNPDGTSVPLITGAENHASYADKYAPLNTPYKYAVTTKASSGAVKTVYVDNELSMRKWFAYSGNTIAAADYTTGGTTHSYSRPNRVRVHYVGRKDPVSYDDGSVDFSVDTTFFIIDKAQADDFERIMENDARGIVKTGDGLVYHADFELSTSNTLERHYSGKVVFKAHRIEGERL